MTKFKTYFNLFFVLFMSIFTSATCFALDTEISNIFAEACIGLESSLQKDIKRFQKFLKKEGVYHAFIENMKNWKFHHITNILEKDLQLFFKKYNPPHNWLNIAFNWNTAKYPEYAQKGYEEEWANKMFVFWSCMSKKWKDYYEKSKTFFKGRECTIYMNDLHSNRVELARLANHQYVSIMNPTKEEVKCLQIGDRIQFRSTRVEFKVNEPLKRIYKYNPELFYITSEITWLVKDKSVKKAETIVDNCEIKEVKQH